MLCSIKELGLGEEADGILILPTGLTLGQPVFKALGLRDVLYEIGLTPNRPDCLSVVGVAREVSAMVEAALQLPDPAIAESGQKAADKTSVVIDDANLCPRYAARLIGSPDTVLRRIEEYRNLGVEMLHMDIRDPLFQQEVLPQLAAL